MSARDDEKKANDPNRGETRSEAREARADAAELNNALIAGLVVTARDLGNVANDLYRSAVLSRVQKLLILMSLLVLTVFGGIGIFQQFQLQKIAKINKTNTSTIRDCTEPTGQCFKDGQKRTGEAVAVINKVVIAAAACAHDPRNDTEDKIKLCVTESLARQS